MSTAASIGDFVAAELVAEGAAKGFAIDRDTPAAIQEIRQGQKPVVGAQRITLDQRPESLVAAPPVAYIGDVPEPAIDAPAPEPDIEFEPELPDELRELLDEDDDDYVLEPAAVELDDEPLGYEDELAKLRRENAKLAKKAEFADKQAVEAKKAKWTAEANKFFPLSTPETITADSRRGFLRAAEAQHNAVKNNPLTARFHEQAVAAANAEAAQIVADARVQAQSSWGRPVAGPGLVPVQEGADQDALAKARKQGDLPGIVGHLLGNIPGRR